MAPPPYPLPVNRIFALGWSMFRFGWRALLAVAAMCLVPAYIVTVPISAAFSPRVDGWLVDTQNATRLNLPPPAAPPDFGVAIVALVFSTIVLMIGSLVANAALVAIVGGLYGGKRLSTGAALRVALSRLLSLVGAQLLYFVGVVIIVMIGLILAGSLFVGGGLLVFIGVVVLVGTVAAVLFFAVRTLLLTQPIMLEGASGADGVARSWRLVAGSGWRVFGYMLLFGFAGVVVGLIGGGVAAVAGISGTLPADYLARGVLEVALSILLAPFAPMVLTLLYYDLRWQHGEDVPIPGSAATVQRPNRI